MIYYKKKLNTKWLNFQHISKGYVVLHPETVKYEHFDYAKISLHGKSIYCRICGSGKSIDTNRYWTQERFLREDIAFDIITKNSLIIKDMGEYEFEINIPEGRIQTLFYGFHFFVKHPDDLVKVATWLSLISLGVSLISLGVSLISSSLFSMN